MSPEEKVQYVKDRIDEETLISPKGPIWYFIYSVGHPDNPEEWTILTKSEQKRIIRKLEEEKYIKNVQLSEDGKGFWLEKVKKRIGKKKHLKNVEHLIDFINEDLQPEVQALKNKAQLIKTFNSFDLKSLKTNEKIYLLKVFYSYYEAIIITYYGSGLFFLSSGIDDLNDYFKILRKKIIEIINSDDTLLELKTNNTYNTIIEPMTSLYSSAEFLDGIWEDAILPSIINFREDIADKDLFENNSEIHKTSVVVVHFLNAISKEIDILKNDLDQRTKNFYKIDLPREEISDKSTNTPKKEKIIKHEHIHKFTDINLNHKYNKEGAGKFYITKKEDDFYYKGINLNLSKNSGYYRVFCALYAKLPEGGEVSYKDLIAEIKNRVSKTKNETDEKIQKFIQDNLTGKSNGFMRYADIPKTEDNGKPLIKVVRARGIEFNNKMG